MIQPIETAYRGYKFRSRLEARWAVFFDTLGIAWQYEKEGYDLGANGRYLPDFWLPHFRVWAEVKGELTDRDERKIMGMAWGADGNAPVLLLTEIDGGGQLYCLDQTDDSGGGACFPFTFGYCLQCQDMTLVIRDRRYLLGEHDLMNPDYSRWCPPCVCEPPGSAVLDASGVAHAVLAARQARFEHGENASGLRARITGRHVMDAARLPY